MSSPTPLTPDARWLTTLIAACDEAMTGLHADIVSLRADLHGKLAALEA
jgi:hypothetical protein